MRARHGVWRVYTLVIFAVLLAAALLDAGLFSVENGYTDNVREVHEPLWLTRLDPLRHAPLELKSVVGGAKSVRRFMHRRLPTLADVVEDRTTATRDFYEPFNLLRVPGAHARAAEQRILAAVTRHVARLRTTTPPSAHEDDTRDNDKDANDSADSHITSTDALAAAAATADGADTTTVVVDYAAKRVPLMAAVAPAAETATATTSPQRTRVRYEDLVRLGKGSKRTTPWRRYDVARTRRTRPPRYAWRKFFIAVNLYKNEDVLPFLTGALVAFLEDEVAPFFDVATSVVVSIYANTSPDLTAVLIREFLIPHLQRAGVQTIYVATHGVCMGYATRQFFHERIEWMACVRNKALEPLYDHGMRLFRHANNNNNNYTAAAKDGGGVPGTNTADDADDDADTLVVLFFNDIFFRAHDVSVLLETVPEPVTWARVPVDGMLGSVVDAPDTPRTSPSVVTPPPQQQQQQARQGARAAAAGGGDGGGARGTSFDMACGMDFFYTFYDTWVTRDWRGWPLLSWPPYTDDAITREAMQRSQAAAAAAATTAARRRRRDDGDGDDDDGRTARYGIPVKCCWNGVAAIRGSLFLQREGRRQQEEEEEAQRTSPDAVAVSRATAAPPTHEHPAANDAHADDEERQHAANSTTTPTSPSAAPLRHTSGAMYDAISEAAALHDMLRGLYTRVLLRRLADVRMRWHSVHSYLARIDPRRPRVQPVGAITVPALLSELQADATGLATLPMTALMHVGVDATAANNNTCHRHARDKRVCLVRDDSAYYRARHPALRFRHSFVPSYGITARSTRHGRAHHNTTGAVVVDDVCLSSECLLFCEDVLQAVVLQQRRVPVILMNPNVRVAYEARHFDRITTHRLYTSPLFLRGAVALRALKLWTDKLRCAYHRCHVVPHARRAPFCALCPANEHALQLRDRIGVIVQPPVSTRNDWPRGGGGGGDDAVLSLTVPTYGGGGVARRALVNVTQLSYMTCFDPGDTHAALLEPLRFVFLSCRLFVCAVALGVLLASWRRHSQARTPRRGSVNGNVMGGSSSSFGGVVVVNGGGGSSSSSSSTRGRRLRWLTSRYGRGSAEHVVRIKAM